MSRNEFPQHNGQAPQAVPAGIAEAEEREVPVAEIDPEDNARKHFDPEPIQALAASIHEHGLLNSILVYRHPESGRFRLIAGERRWRAAQLLGWTTIRARVLKERPDDATRSELALIDNEQRENLDDIERGLAYLDYTARTGCSASTLARKLGKAVSTVTRAIQLVQKLPADIHDLVRAGQLPPFAARQLVRLPDDDSKRRFAALFGEGEGKVKTAAELAAAIKNGTATPAAPTAFTAEEAGVKVAVTVPAGDLAAVEAALRVLLKDLREHGSRGLAHFKEYLARKAVASRKAAELEAAQAALNRHPTT